MVTLEMLAAATSKMRKAQNRYFKERGHILLKESKKAEAEVDRPLKEIESQTQGMTSREGQQTSLFG